METLAIACSALLASAAASATEPFDAIPGDVVSLLASPGHRYVSTFECAADGCGYRHYFQRFDAASKVACTRRIAEIGLDLSTAYPVWKDRPETLYLTVIDVGQGRSYSASITTGDDCSYTFKIEPLTRESDAKSRHPGDRQAPAPADASRQPASTSCNQPEGDCPVGEIAWWDIQPQLWERLVPRSGQADTVQGELIRAIGKATDEAYRNGNRNWASGYERLVRFVVDTLDDPKTFSDEQRRKIRASGDTILANVEAPDLSGHGSAHYHLTEMAVRWCLANPEPIPHRHDASLRV